MDLNSITFLFWFLPIFITIYSICKLRIRAALVLLASLFVCAWGNLDSLFFLLTAILFNYGFGLLLSSHKNCLSLAVVWNLAYLVLFKFFAVSSTLPLGISYYTLSAISYCADVSRGDAKAFKNPAKLALYLAFFPKLIMGPTVLFKDFEDQCDWPSVNSDMLAEGILKFTIGLGKKMIIAGLLADLSTSCWADAANSTASAWLGLIGFSLQLYYDFSGYSDMAIGLSRMMGFEIKENFNYPYQSSSLSSFWSNWHISLSRWFKDYMYFPLGGNRLGQGRTILNVFLVWIATGIWHGNGWNYIFWGIFLCIFVCLEKMINIKKIPNALGILITDFIVIIGWVFFNSPSMIDAFNYIGYLFGAASAVSSGIARIYWLDSFPMMLIAAIGSTSFPKTCAKQIFPEDSMITTIAKCIFILAILGASSALLVINGYTPFIYQSF